MPHPAAANSAHSRGQWVGDRHRVTCTGGRWSVATLTLLPPTHQQICSNIEILGNKQISDSSYQAHRHLSVVRNAPAPFCLQYGAPANLASPMVAVVSICVSVSMSPKKKYTRGALDSPWRDWDPKSNPKSNNYNCILRKGDCSFSSAPSP